MEIHSQKLRCWQGRNTRGSTAVGELRSASGQR